MASSWAVLEASWERLVATWAFLEASKAVLGHLGAVLEPSASAADRGRGVLRSGAWWQEAAGTLIPKKVGKHGPNERELLRKHKDRYLNIVRYI